jgi:hypothetical protein
MPPNRKLERVEGRCLAAPVRRGTASEHKGILLETPDGERLLLVRIGGNPFEDPQTASFAGTNVVVEGYRVGNELRYVSIEPSD